jgi:hypothetical protein
MIDVVLPDPTSASRDGAAAVGGAADAPPAPAGDVFALGRAAAAAAAAANGGRGVFARSRQLLGTGVWRGPRDAAESYVEEEDLAALGGLAAAQQAGVRTVAASSAAVARAAHAAGLRVLWRLGFRGGEPAAAREARFAEVRALLDGGVALAGVVPTPDGEPMGLDTLRVVAACRLQLGVAHVVADFVKLGHRLAQMSLGFGADELFGPIMPERALRLGANAGNPVMTRKEAAMLLRGAGLVPCERLASGELEECVS